MQAIYLLRTALQRTGFDLVRDPFRYRFMHALGAASVESVLDIGANTGQFASELRGAGFPGRIVSVEPLSRAYAELSARSASDRTWSAERAVVSSALGSLTVNVSANSVSSSVLAMTPLATDAAPGSSYVSTEEVTATTIDDLVARHDLTPERALLKLDVQGYEMDVLEGAVATLPRFAMVRAELSLAPLYEGQALMHQLVAYLAERKFELAVVEPGFSDPRSRRLLQFDGTFVRSDASA